jgi:hypothetical protein
VSTPENQPNAEEALARARETRAEMAAALDEDQKPDVDEPVGWQPIWKRPRTPKSKEAKKKELARAAPAAPGRRQAPPRRRELAPARSRQNRIGNAAARRDARALSRVRHSNAWLW